MTAGQKELIYAALAGHEFARWARAVLIRAGGRVRAASFIIHALAIICPPLFWKRLTMQLANCYKVTGSRIQFKQEYEHEHRDAEGYRA